jgi:RHS repeat-associated protein
MVAIPGMNPGIFVLGGGGDGGGSGEGGGKGKGGKQGANGKNGGNDANGGGKGAGACGAGGPGACTNCGHNISQGDPVDVASGKVFTIPKRDLFLPGPFALDFLRSYSSSMREVDVGMGFGWVHSLGWSIHEKRRMLSLVTGDGRQLEIPRPLEVGDFERSGAFGVYRGAELYVVNPGNEFEHHFTQVEADSSDFRLRLVRYRNRGHIALHYENGALARAVDAAGRVILFHTNAQRRITSIAVPDPRGNAIVFARYAYDDRGNMVAATDADGHTTYYDYDDDHRMTKLEYPSGCVIHYTYDAHGRCEETWGDYPGRTDPALAPGLGDKLADGKTVAKGIFHCRMEYAEDNSYTEVVDSVRLQRFFSGPADTVARAVNGRGGVTERTYDERNRVVTKTDAEGGVWQYGYNELDLVGREVDPDGNAVTVTYDAAGCEVEIVDAAGGVTTIERDSFGEITSVKDPAGATMHFVLNAVGLPLTWLDWRGQKHAFEWDNQGNCISHTFPNGAKAQYEYDWWGRRVREIDPNGEQLLTTFDNSGRITSTVNPLGQAVRFQYDGMGNVVSITRPDGATIFREYGGLNWLYRLKHADGSELRGHYNREGWMVQLDNERGEKYLFDHTPDGLVSWEKNFHGQEIRFGYDLLGRTIWYDDGAGKYQRTLSPAGLLLKEEAPDGSIREFEYNPRGDLICGKAGAEAMELSVDPIGRVLGESLLVDGTRYTIDTQRTVAGDRVASHTSLGFDLQIRRDPVGRVAEIWSGKDRILGITRNLLSQPVRRDLDGGGAIVDAYDPARRLKRRQILGPGTATQSVGEPAWVSGSSPGVVERIYDYTPIQEVLKVTSSDGNDVEYEYDIRRNLSKVQRKGSTEEFTADAAGNHHERGANAPTRVYDAGSQLVRWADYSYRYDDRGFMVEKRKAASGVALEEITRYSWNAWGLLDRVELPDGTKVEFQYDPFARRLGKRVVRDGRVVAKHHYVWDQLNMVHDVDLTAPDKPEVRTYLFEDNDDLVPLGHREGDRWVHYVNDVNGIPEEIVDGAGRPVGKLARTPFGRTHLAAGSVSTPFRHPGQQEDAETGLHYNRYRYYDPDTGRFISADPLSINGAFNLYQFAPNPIGWSDPMGWQHVMNVVSATGPVPPGGPPVGGWPMPTNHANPGTGGNQYCSGAVGVPCPPSLTQQANCHTEQKFAQNLIDHNNNLIANGQPGIAGNNYHLNGQLPPCPTCHQAMRTAAAQTGANITYSWGQPPVGSVTYNGGQPASGAGSAMNPNQFQGAAAALAPTYGAPGVTNPARRWGSSSSPGSWGAYYGA